MDGYKSEKKWTFMFYEFLGTLIFSYGVNVGAGAGPYALLFAAFII
jgi:hypothetical protein